MNIKEKQFWKTIKKHLPGDISRIENIADVGTPDMSGAFDNSDYWVELKVCDNKNIIKGVKNLLKPSQNVWHLRRGNQGSIIFVAVYYPNMKKIFLYKLNRISGYYTILITISKKFNWGDFEAMFINHLT